jgi:3-hydroxymyristoyl/3-hydroxydecanoyl-(acyl carrier protein) dehydratase
MAIEPAWHAVVRHIPAAHPAADGHFPGNPIMPGAMLLAEILDAMALPGACEIRAAKFLQPVRPGTALSIRWRAKSATEIIFEALQGESLALSGTLLLKAEAS